MPIETFAGKAISNTYQRVVQTDGTYLADGTGSILNNLTLPGNLIISGTLYAQNTVIVTQSFSSGSNQLGDAANDFQTLYGTVRIPTGSLTVTGSTIVSSSAATQLLVGTGSLFVSSSGQVGIGITTPSSNLEIVQAQNSYGDLNALLIRDSSNIQANFSLKGGTGATHPTLKVASLSPSLGGTIGGSALFVNYYDLSNFYPIRFLGSIVDFETTTSTYASRTTSMRIFSNSNIGISTTTDAGFKLDVSGSGRFSGNLTITGSATNSLLVKGSGTTNATTALLIQNSAGSTNAQIYDDGQWFIGTGNIRLSGTPGNFGFNTAVGNVANIGHWGINFQPLGYSGISINMDNSIRLSGPTFITGSLVVTGSFTVTTGSLVEFQVTNTGTKLGNATTDTHSITGSIAITSSASTSSAALQIYKSGSTVLNVQGSSGQLFSITDSLTGSLFSVNTVAGLPVMEAFSDNTVNIGKYGIYPIKVAATGTLAVVTGSFTGSFIGLFTGSFSGSGTILSASFALSASLSSTASYVNPLTQSLIVSGSGTFTNGLIVTGSSSVTGSLTVTGSYTLGDRVTASGLYATSIGRLVTASGDYSFAHGNVSKAIGAYSFAQGVASIAQGNYSHAEGDTTIAWGTTSHAEGGNTFALGNYSHAEGYYTSASADYQHVEGKYNLVNNNALWIVGNGTSVSNRSNIIQATTSSVEITGSLFISGSGKFTNGLTVTGSTYVNNYLNVGSTDNIDLYYDVDGRGGMGFGSTINIGNTSINRNLRILTPTDGGNGTVSIGYFKTGQWRRAFTIDNSPTTPAVWLQPDGGNVTIGTTTDPGDRLFVSGSTRITNGLTVSGSTILTNLLYVSSSGDTAVYAKDGALRVGQWSGSTVSGWENYDGLTINPRASSYSYLIMRSGPGTPADALGYYTIFETANSYGNPFNLKWNNTNFFSIYEYGNRVAIGGNYVGIGNTSPQYTLDVTGTGRFTTALLVTGTTVISGSLRGIINTLPITSGTASMDCSLGNFFDLTLTAGSTLYLLASNIQPGQTVNLRVTQPATSGSLTYGSQFKFAGGIPYSASATGSAVDLISFISYDTSTLYGSAIKNLS